MPIDRLNVNLDLLQRLANKRIHDDVFERRTESEIRSEYIEPLFSALGWDTTNMEGPGADDWRREEHGVQGRADYVVYVHGRPLLLIEAKRSGGVTGLAQRGRYVDRTAEERQTLRYARERRAPWAILTNFDKLIVFDAEEERVLFGFDSSTEYIPSIAGDPAGSIRQLMYLAVSGGSLDWIKELTKKKEIDRDFLALIQDTRLVLAQDLIRNHETHPALQSADGGVSLSVVHAVVQRILDRLILMRFADDHEILRTHDLLGNLLKHFDMLGVYHEPDELHSSLVRLWRTFDRIHDTTIFQQGHICEILSVSNETLHKSITALNGTSFRKFTSDVLGATYESYLGTSLAFDASGRLVQRADPARRRSEGIYYTPGYVVASLVAGTLGSVNK